MIEKLEIYDLCIGVCYHPIRNYLYDTRLQHEFRDDGFTPLTGWIFFYAKRRKRWFLRGFESTAQEVFESLTDEEKAEALWELDEWK